MAGALTISTLNNDTGVLQVQNGMTGVGKAWVNFNGQGTVTIRGSFNVSSITDNGSGAYTVNFTTAMVNANYAASVINSGQWTGNAHVVAYVNDGVQDFGGYNPPAPTTSGFNITLTNPNNGGQRTDSLIIMCTVMAS